MKKIVLLALLTANYIWMFGQANFETKDRNRIAKNHVKTQIQWAYDYVNGKPSTKGYISSKTMFDKQGNAIEVINYKSDGSITSVMDYTYDNQNNKTSYSRYRGNKETLTYNQKILYDPKGNKLAEAGFDGVSNYYNTFTYGNDGRLSEIKYTTDRIVTEKRIFNYKGNVTEMTVVNGNNSMLSREITTHDNKQNILEEVKYIQDNVTQKSSYEYNPQGKKVEETKINYGRLAYHRKYKYDNRDNLLEITEQNPEEKAFTAYAYQYDNSGNPVVERWAKDNTSEYSSKEHTYDSNDLLVKSDCYFASYKFSVLYKYTYLYY